MRLLVCGPRRWGKTQAVTDVLDRILSKYKHMVLIEGGASGVDQIAGEWADKNGDRVVHIRFPAPWSSLGKRAGPIRNSRMLAFGNPEALLAFQPLLSNTPGTQDMIRKAWRYGLRVRVQRCS